MAKKKSSKSSKKPVKHILSGVHAPTLKKGKAKSKLSPAAKLKAARLAILRKKKLSAKDKHFEKVRGKVTAGRRGKKTGNKAKKSTVVAGRFDSKGIKIAKTPSAKKAILKEFGKSPLNSETITTKAGKQLPVKYKQPVKVGNSTIYVPFSRAPSKNNPIAELNRWKKVIAHLTTESASAKGKQKQHFEKAIANAKIQMKKHGHKIPNFVGAARAKNPSLVGKAKKRAENRKAKRAAAKVGVSSKAGKGKHQYKVGC